MNGLTLKTADKGIYRSENTISQNKYLSIQDELTET